MAVLRIPDEKKTLREEGEIRDYLAGIGIDYERWEIADRAHADASADVILSAYAPEIEKLKAQGGYVTADVIDVKPDTVGLDAMLAKFSIEQSTMRTKCALSSKDAACFMFIPRHRLSSPWKSKRAT